MPLQRLLPFLSALASALRLAEPERRVPAMPAFAPPLVQDAEAEMEGLVALQTVEHHLSTKTHPFIPCSDGLWTGDTAQGEATAVDVVVSFCRRDLSWLRGELESLGVHVRSVTIFSKCGQSLEGQGWSLPDGARVMELPNVGRCDHTIAHYLAQEMKKLRQERDEAKEVILFLKDSHEIHDTLNTLRSLKETTRIAAGPVGFGCGERPKGGSQFHLSEKMKPFRKDSYLDRGGDAFSGGSEDFGTWVQQMGAELQSPVMPICFGGTFAASRRSLGRIDTAVWDRLEESLSRGDNIEEGHYAERLWANMMMQLEKETLEALYQQSVNSETEGEGMGRLHGCKES